MRLSFTDQRQGEMREWREVAARPDGAAARHARDHAALEAPEQKLDRLDARTRRAFRERVGAEDHRGADDLAGVRLADAAGVAPQQPQLQLLGQLFGDGLRDEPAEAGVDPVGVLARAVRGAFDQLTRCAHLRARLVGERDAGFAVGDRAHVFDPEIVPGQADRGRLSHRGRV